MLIEDYLSLRNAIAEELDRTDLTDKIDGWVQLAESDIRADARTRGVTIDEAITIDDGEITLPSDIKIVRSLYDEYGEISLVSPERIASLNKLYSGGGVRAAYAAILAQETDGASAFIMKVAPIPSSSVTATIVYEPDLLPLTDDTDTNWLLRKHPNVYFYGALVHSAPWLKEDARLEVWDKLYERNMSKLTRLRDDLEFGAGPLVAMPRNAIG